MEPDWTSHDDGRHVWLRWGAYCVYESAWSTPAMTLYTTGTGKPYQGRWLGESLTLSQAKQLAYEDAARRPRVRYHW